MCYVITINPEPILFKKILAIKNAIKKEFGKQLYLDDDPHCTLYICKLNDETIFNDFYKKFQNLNVENFKINISDWLIFEKDPITFKKVLGCKLNNPKLNNLQLEIVNFFQKYRKKEVIQRYKNVNFSGELKNNLDKYGFPFVGEIWIPHISIGSFDEVVFDKIWQKFKGEYPKGDYYMNSIVIYKLNELNNKLTKIKEINL